MVNQYYEIFFDIVAPVYEKFRFDARKTFNTIKSIVIFEPSNKVIDSGGGTGRVAKFLANKVQKVIVVDISKRMIKQCQRAALGSGVCGSQSEFAQPTAHYALLANFNIL